MLLSIKSYMKYVTEIQMKERQNTRIIFSSQQAALQICAQDTVHAVMYSCFHCFVFLFVSQSYGKVMAVDAVDDLLTLIGDSPPTVCPTGPTFYLAAV